jgi:hypothetical protein
MHRKHTTAEDGMQNARSVSHSGKTLRRRLSFRPVAIIAAAFAALLTTGLVAGPLAGVSGAASATSHALATAGLGYTPLASPVRIADTRTVAGGGTASPYNGKTLAEGTSLTVDVPSTDVPATASAVVVNITAVGPTNGGFLSVFPGGGTNPGTSNVNFATGQNVGDQVTVGLGLDAATASAQSFTVYDGPTTGGATVDFTADLVGYYAPPTTTTGDAYNGLTPARILDTRTGSGAPGAGSTLTTSSESINVSVVGGTTGVPASATAVALNVAVTNTTAPSFITAFPTGVTQPGTASQNFVAGETLSSQVVAGVGTGGDVTIANHAGNADIVVDVDGYFTAAGGTGSLLTVLPTPVRLQDTRASGNILTGSGGIAGGASTTAVVQGAGATAGVLSVADVATPGDGNFLTAYPTGGATPLAATVNYVPGDPYNIVENAAYATTGTGGSVSVLNGPSNASPANVVVDEDGYFSAASTPVNGTSVALSATPTSVVANGATSALVATVTNATTGPVSGDTVTFSSTGVCGTIAPASGSSSATGTVDATYTSSSSAGNCTITATESANGAASNPVVITQTALPTTFHTAVAASPNMVNTTAPLNTSTVTVTVTGPGNSPISGDQVEVIATNASGSPLGCGTLVATLPLLGVNNNFGTTGATGALDGKAQFTYTSGSLVGNCTITAFEADQGTSGNTGTTAITQVLQGYSITDVASPSAVIANGTLTTTITATVLHSGTPQNVDPVTFTFGTPEPAATCGTFAGAATVNTNSAGQASITYTSPNLSVPPPTSGFCPVIATETLGSATTLAPALVDNQGGSVADVLAVNPTPNSISVGATSAVTATATGASGTGIVGDEVFFTTSGPCTIAPAFEATGAGGITPTILPATVTGVAAGTCTVTATESNSGKTGTTTITVNPIVNSVAVTASPSTITGNGITTSSITATVTGPSAAGDSVTFHVTPAVTGATCGTIPTIPVIVNAGGQAVDTYTSSANAGFCIVSATESATGISGFTQIDQTSV